MSVETWLALSTKDRSLLAEQFNLRKSGFVHVSDNVVISDGYQNADLSVLDLKTLQGVTGSNIEDFSWQLETCLKVLRGEVNTAITVTTSDEPFVIEATPTPSGDSITVSGGFEPIPVKNKGGRPRKNANVETKTPSEE